MLQLTLSRYRFDKVKAPTLAVLLVIGLVIVTIPVAIESVGSTNSMDGTTVIIAPVLHNNVTVYRDDLGVPHIYAEDSHDAYYALGYVMAQDRLFEMDLFRRATAGRLAELFSDLMFNDDVEMRTLGIYQTANDTWNGLYPDIVIPQYVRDNLEMFSAGVNRYVSDLVIPDDVPHEWRMLSDFIGLPLSHFMPYPWTPIDSVAIAGMMGLMLGDTSAEEVLRGGLVAVNANLAEFLMPTGWINMTTIMPPDFPGGQLASIESITAPLQRLLGFSGLGGSNNWVVDNLNTTTGYAILANDPHLDLQAPGIWWQVHMNITDYANVIGVMIAGGPVVGAGHNDYFAWGPTNFMADIVDMYYYERNTTHYWYIDHWEPFNVTYETIYNLETAVQVPVVSTRHGPLINTSLAAPYDKMAFRWGGKEFGYGEILGFSKLMNATDLPQWREALSHISVVIQNWVYADKIGNIAWCPSGKLPVRPPPPPNGTGTMGALPSNGSAGQNEWIIDPSTNRTFSIPHSTSPAILPPPWNQNYSDPISLPYAENPAQGYIATANNQPIDPSYPGYPWPVWISPACGFAPGYRGQRIEEMIESLAPIDIDDMKKIQADSLCIPARNIVPILNQSMQGDTNTTIQNAVELLANWNYTELRDMAEPLIWEVFLEKFTDNTFDDEPWADDFYPFPNTIIPLWNMTQNPSSAYAQALFDDNTTGPVEDMADIMNNSLHDALDWIISQLGAPADENFSNWEYGDLHVVDFDHPMGSFMGYFNVPQSPPYGSGPVGCDGGAYTVDPGGHHHKLIVQDVLYVGSGASYRGIFECNDNWNTSLILVPPGEGGTVTGPFTGDAPVFNPHYADTFQKWLNNEYTTCLFNDTEIQNYSKTIFTPNGHDVAIVSVTPTKAVIGRGYSANISITIENRGTYTETFNVTTYVNTTLIHTFVDIILTNGSFTTVNFTWSTTGIPYAWPYPTYTLSANTTSIPHDIDTTDNTYIYGTVKVVTPGDIDGNGHIWLTDLSILADHWYGHDPATGKTYHAGADIDSDGFIWLIDLSILADYWYEGPLD